VELTSRDVDPLEEGVDIAIQVGQPRDSTLIARKLFESRRRLCASPAYLAQHGTPRTVQELAGHRALHLPVDSLRHWPLLGENIACQRVLACNNITLAREAALAGAGIAALPVMISEAAVQDGELIELLPEARLPTGELYAVYPSRRFQAMKVKAFLDFLIASLPQAGLLEPAGAGLLTSRL
jgi:DNA-binding transcriptional LysR family regulator